MSLSISAKNEFPTHCITNTETMNIHCYLLGKFSVSVNEPLRLIPFVPVTLQRDAQLYYLSTVYSYLCRMNFVMFSIDSVFLCRETSGVGTGRTM